MISTLSKKHSFDPVFDSRNVFRLILEAMSNPARIVNIKEYGDKLFGGDPLFLAVALTLLDNEVSFNTCENLPLADEIASLTLAKKANVETADFVFVREAEDIRKVTGSVKTGTPEDPHKSASVFIRNDGENSYRLTFFGPGVNGRKTTGVTQTVKDAIALRDARDCEYPQGIDLIFISGAGDMFAVPRSIRTEA